MLGRTVLMEKEKKMAKAKSKAKKTAPAPKPAPAPATKKASILEKCPVTRSISEWCNYVSANAMNFTDAEVTEARQHIQATQV